MARNQALEAVEQYFKLWSQKDYHGFRAYLANDLSFKGPFDTFQRADDLIRGVSRIGPTVKEIRTRRIFPMVRTSASFMTW